ncbi:MAG: S53 family peptidase [Kofleriaceae bacterium]
MKSLLAIGFGAVLLASCASAEREDGSDRNADELGSIPQHQSTTVCNGGALHCYALHRTDVPYASAPQGFGASDLQSAYKIDTTKGTGQVVAVVDAYNYPNADADLKKYRAQMGLPECSVANGCFKIVNQSGSASPLPGNAPANDDWTVEAALDLDMASAACPKCKLILVEADDDQGDGLYLANDGAVTAGATVVSNSWGGPEPTNSASLETHFTHSGVGYFVSSGDNGYTGTQSDYPSTSAHVVAVGGTSLVKSSNTRGWTEGAWNDAGSACSKNIAKPSYQTSSACAKRAAADVSAVADPNTGVAVYNGGWQVIGGTSASSPFVAAVFAMYGIGSSGPSYPYGHAASFFDVTTGSNGSCTSALCKAAAGWDGPTGLGTPNGTALGGGGGTCTPNCTGKACGDDGCGGSCGSCTGTDTCTGGVCQSGGGGGSGGSGGGGGTCDHPICSTGGALDGTCDSCAAEVCAADDYCCTNAWDSICVGEVSSVCGQSCSGGGGGSTCTHSECSTGGKLKKGCDSCATAICTEDSYCCATKWDSQCVSEVSSICNESCN